MPSPESALLGLPAPGLAWAIFFASSEELNKKSEMTLLWNRYSSKIMFCNV